jgi:hypothetical protein
MSRTEIYAIRPEDGSTELEAEIHNSWRGAVHVWTTLAVQYGLLGPGEEGYLMIRPGLLDQMWKLKDDDRLSWWEKVCLISTFDQVVILRDDIERLIEAYGLWVAMHGSDGSQGEQLRVFQQILDHERPFRGICFNQTSVNSNPWWVYDGSGEDEEGRPFNIDRDTDWWSLFDVYPALREAVPSIG